MIIVVNDRYPVFAHPVCYWFSIYWYSPLLVGASLSEPHTSVTALHTCVSIRLTIYGPTTYRKF